MRRPISLRFQQSVQGSPGHGVVPRTGFLVNGPGQIRLTVVQQGLVGGR